MSGRAATAALALGLSVGVAWAEDPAADDAPKDGGAQQGPGGMPTVPVPSPAPAQEGDADQQPDVDDTVAGRRLGQGVGDVDLMDRAEWEAQLKRYEGRPHPPIYYLGSHWLGIDPAFIASAHEGLNKIYLRDYKGANAHFVGMESQYRGMAIGPVGQVLVWQALMLENFDFKYEPQYEAASRRARQQLEEAFVTPGNEAWENFLMAGMLGIESIHTMRHEEYAKALSRGYEAMKAVKRCQELAPEFVDIQLGDGLFDYWATVISKATKLIPDMGDKRAEGIRQMMKVEERSLFLRAPATLALTFTWIEEGKRKQALDSALKNHALYPDNIINNQVLGRVYTYNRMYAKAEATFKGIQQVDPNNERSHYYLGRLYLRWGKKDEAQASFERYLAFPELSKDHRAYGLYYLGQVHYRNKDYAAAEKAWKEAWKVARLKRARSRLDRMAERTEPEAG